MFRALDVLRWFGHSLIAGLIMFLSLWLLVPNFDIWRSLRYAGLTTGTAFTVGMLHFGGVCIFFRMKSRHRES